MKGNPSRQDVISAMAEFDRHGMPIGFDWSVHYYLVHPKTSKLYPPKAIWGLSTGLDNCFNAQEAKRWLEKLNFFVHDARLELSSLGLFDEVSASYRSSPEQRRANLRSSNTEAEETLILVRRFKRNPHVIAERLYIANGHCEECRNPAPFQRASNNTPFLEVHHVKPLADGGEDTVENTRALCPNCHRKAHYG